jgi:hypothetical protein
MATPAFGFTSPQTVSPELSLDFTGSSIDPRITFSRASIGRYYDGSTTAVAEQNLLVYSNKFDEVQWVKTDLTATNSGGSLGPDLVINGTFTTDSDWTKGTGWAIGSGVATKTAGTASLLSQNIGAVAGAFYQLTFTMTRTAGTLSVRLGSTSNQFSYTSGGTRTINLLCGSTDSILYFSADASFAGTVDDVIVKRISLAPDRSSTTWQLSATSSNGTLTQQVTSVNGDYTFSVWMRRVTGTGNVDITADSAGTWVTQSVTTTWTRFVVTQTLTAGTITPGIRLVTSGDEIEIWRSQLEQRSSVTEYTPTTTQPVTNYIPVLLTAAIDAVRLDHNPVTGESRGILIENQVANLLNNSENFSAWTASSGRVLNNVVIAPDGNQTADLFYRPFGATGNEDIYRNASVVGSGNTCTFSFYAKAAGFTGIQLAPGGGFTGGISIFNLSNGTIASGPGRIEAVGNGWYRCSHTATRSATGDFEVYLAIRNPNLVYPTGQGIFAGVYVWGFQVELNARQTSYIQTTSTSITRNADLATMTGTDFSDWYNASKGTFRVDASTPANGLRPIISADDDTANESLVITTDGTAPKFIVKDGGSEVANVSAGTVTANTAMFAYVSYDTDYFGIARPTARQVDTSGAVPTVDRLRIGRDQAGNYINGHIQKIQFWP